MNTVRRAVIDVGTNSVKLLVADVTNREVRPVWEESNQTRLGRGFYENHRLRPEAIAATAKAVKDFSLIAKEKGAVSSRVIATSAARDALNGQELARAIHESSHLQMQVISGEQEADWVFKGVASEPSFAREKIWLLDVGGGSTEFIIGEQRQVSVARSFDLGTLRLLEAVPHSDPPSPAQQERCRHWVKTFVKTTIRPWLEAAGQAGPRAASGNAPPMLVATGGSATIIARIEGGLQTFEREHIEAVRVSRDRIRFHARELWALPLEQRKKVPGLPPNRADVILTGLVIYETLMEEFNLPVLRVSTRGLRFAAIMDGA